MIDFTLELFGCLLDGVIGSHSELVKVFELAVRTKSQTKHVYQDLLVGFFDTKSLAFDTKTHKP